MREIPFREIRVGDVLRIEYQTADAEVTVVGPVSRKFSSSLTIGDNHVHRVMPHEHYYLIRRKLSVADVEAAIESIRESAADDEHAHGLEITLHQSVLEAIAKNECEDPKSCAAAALKSRDIEFRRHT